MVPLLYLAFCLVLGAPFVSSAATPTVKSAPRACSPIQTAALAAMSNLMSPNTGYWYPRDCRNGLCGHFPEPGTDAPGLSARLWTNVNAFETIYNTEWSTGNTEWSDLSEIQSIVPNRDHGSSNQLPVTRGYTSQDDACWAGLFYIKVQQYNDAHNINPGDKWYYDEALDIQKSVAGTWLTNQGCGGGIPQYTTGMGPNTISTHLFFSLTAYLAEYSDPDGSLKAWTQTIANWYTTGKGLTLRDTDGLYFDSQNPSCSGADKTKWTYNQGPIISALGVAANLLRNPSYITFAQTIIDGIIAAPSNIPLPERSVSTLEFINGNIAEGCDGVRSSTCDQDQLYFKGAFMKHMQYFLDNADDAVREKYAGFVGEQASAVIHYATGPGGLSGSVWYAPNQGGSIFDYETQVAALDALNCAQKYANC